MLDLNFVRFLVLLASGFTLLFESTPALKSLLTPKSLSAPMLASLQVLSFNFFCRASTSAQSFKIVDVSKIFTILFSFDHFTNSLCLILFTVSLYLELAGLSLQEFSSGIAGFGALFVVLLFFLLLSGSTEFKFVLNVDNSDLSSASLPCHIC